MPLEPTQPPRGDSGPLHSYRSDRQRLADQIGRHAQDWMAKNGYATPDRTQRLDSDDLRDSLSDAFAIRAGLPVRNPHPLSTFASELSWPRLNEQLQCRSLTSADFGRALAVGFRQIVVTSYDGSDDCGACFLDSVVGDFRPAALPTVDTIDLASVLQSNSFGVNSIPLQTLSTGPGEIGQVRNYRGRVLLSRQLLLNDDFALVTSLMQHLSAHAARLPAQRLGAILTTNPRLVDGQPLMGASNTTAAKTYSLDALTEACGKLRSVTSTTGNILNLKASVWLVPAAGEIPAKATLRQIELTVQSPLQMVTNPWIPSGYSYVICAPQQQPTFIRLLLDPPPLRPSVSQVNLPLAYDGIALDVDFSFGVQPVSRFGIVRIPTA